jgi:hypothetical protein
MVKLVKVFLDGKVVDKWITLADTEHEAIALVRKKYRVSKTRILPKELIFDVSDLVETLKSFDGILPY